MASYKCHIIITKIPYRCTTILQEIKNLKYIWQHFSSTNTADFTWAWRLFCHWSTSKSNSLPLHFRFKNIIVKQHILTLHTVNTFFLFFSQAMQKKHVFTKNIHFTWLWNTNHVESTTVVAKCDFLWKHSISSVTLWNIAKGHQIILSQPVTKVPGMRNF